MTTQLLAKRVLNDSPNLELIHELRSRLNDPEAAGMIVNRMLFDLLTSYTELESAIKAMERLELVADVDTEVGCSLMAHLWGAASKVEGAYDVVDAIDLWIANEGSPMLEHQLRYLADSGVDQSISEHFRSIIKM